jgi:hypothetical protein
MGAITHAGALGRSRHHRARQGEPDYGTLPRHGLAETSQNKPFQSGRLDIGWAGSLSGI